MKRVILPLLVLFGLSMLFALESAPSDVVGYIQYTISANDFDFMALPFGTTMTTASELATNLGGTIESVCFWTGGSWAQYVNGVPFTDFAISEGNSYFVKSGDTSDITYYASGVVGDAASFDIGENDFTQIMLPLDRSDISTASGLCADIGPSVGSISAWNNGSFVQHVAGVPFTDFSIGIGDGLLVYSSEAYTGWNGSTTRNQVRMIETSKSNVATKEIKE